MTFAEGDKVKRWARSIWPRAISTRASVSAMRWSAVLRKIRHLSHHVGAQGCYLAVGASQDVLPGSLNLADEIFVGFFDFAHQGGSLGGKFSRNGAR